LAERLMAVGIDTDWVGTGKRAGKDRHA
jgi:hypothetical protein